MEVLLRRFVSLLGLTALSTASGGAFPADFTDLFDERVKSVVAVRFFIQHEVDREPAFAIGLVFDDEGRVVLLDSAMPSWLPPDRFRDFRVTLPGEDREGDRAEYLGQDFLTGYHFIQIEEGTRDQFTPITRFGEAAPRRGAFLWGIGIMGDTWAFQPYFLGGRLSAVEPLPWLVGFTDTAVASPGSAVFDVSGAFVGWAGRPVTQEKIILMHGDRLNIGLQDGRESTMFLTAAEFFDQIKRVPTRKTGDPRPWLGVTGMQPLDREASLYLGLEEKGAVVVSDVILGSPAAAAGLRTRDIVVAVDGEPLPKLKPDFVIPRYFELTIMEKKIGDTLTLTVIRGDQEIDLEATLIQQPTPLKEARREHFSDLGLTIREFTLFDGISRRLLRTQDEGAIVDFVKPNSPLNAAGLTPGDWIKELDGRPISDYDGAAAAFAALEEDTGKTDFVLLVSRGNETKVLRVKRN